MTDKPNRSVPRPCRIIWDAPESWTVLATEDGVEIRSRSGDALEAPDVNRLVSLVATAQAAVAEDHVTAPGPNPDSGNWEAVRANVAREAIAAVRNAIQSPF